MKWEFCYHEDHNYLEVIISGPLTSHELNQMAVERWSKLRELNCKKVLFDFTQITSMLATVAIYHRPEETEKIGILRGNRTAAVVPDIYWKDFKFMETVYQNQGFDLNVFNNKEDAINYLTKAG
jgi:hypothetical protein